MEYKINAQNKRLGRVATEAAVFLMGKNRTDFARNKIPEVQVEISNAGRLEVTNKKMSEKTYKFYSGYPGGLREPSMKTLVSNKGMREALRKAIYGMLPKNKLRSKMMLNLKITE